MDLGAQPSKPKMTLREVVERYRALAGGFGKPVALGAFGLQREEGEKLFGTLDEDYHISRYFHFTLKPGEGEAWSINSFPQTHVVLDAEIETIL